MSPASLYLTWYRLLYGVVVMLLALRSTSGLVDRSAENGQLPSAPEAVLEVIQDPYIVVVFSVSFWVIRAGLTLSTAADPIVLLRHGSRARWLLMQCVDAAREAASLVAILLVAGIASSAGLPWTGRWTIAAAEDVLGQLLPLWAVSGVPPLLAILLQLVLTLCGLLAIFAGIALATLLATRHRPIVLVVACLLGLTIPLLLFKIPSAGAQSLITLIAGHPVGWPASPILVLCLLIAATVGAARIVDAHPTPPSARLRPVLAYSALCIVLLVLSALSSEAASFSELVRETFYGASGESFSLTRYLLYTLVFLGPGYLAVLSLETDSLPRIGLIAVRHGRISPWLRTILLRNLLVAAVVVAALLTLLALLAVVGGRTLSVEDPPMLWHQFALHGVLQIYITTTLAVLVVLLTGSEVAGLIALLILAVLGLPMLTHGFAPSGGSMLGLLDTAGYTPARGTAILAASSLALTLLGLAVTTLRAPQRLITGRPHARH